MALTHLMAGQCLEQLCREYSDCLCLKRDQVNRSASVAALVAEIQFPVQANMWLLEVGNLPLCASMVCSGEVAGLIPSRLPALADCKQDMMRTEKC